MPSPSPRAALTAPFELPRASRVVVLAPHADDDVLGLGGALALHARRGADVRVLVAFDGRLGLAAGVDPEVRRDEARAAGRELGIAHYEFWDYPEGHEPTAPELAAAGERLARHFESTAPDLVYAPWPGEAHVDHRALARAFDRALAALPRGGAALADRTFGYEVWSACAAQYVLDVTAVWDVKLAALGRHVSQLAEGKLVALAEENARRAGARLGPGRFGEAFVAWRTLLDEAGSAQR
ncbi:MAG: PIG-L family deacetylase [Planctomycetes bacterium]|nr:PIG-L family deacetylase [Planctomycetota bacterium]